jgi:hypothetical protein
MRNTIIKLESINCWAGELGIMPSDDNDMPIMEESKSWVNVPQEFFQQLSAEDKEKVNKLINKEN